MKKIIYFFFVFLGIVNFNVVLAQEEAPKLKPKFFTLRDARLALGLGSEGSTTFSTLSMGKPKGLKAIYKDPRIGDETNYPYLSIGANIDLFSDNSLTGLLIGANYNFLAQGFQTGDTAVDFFEMDRAEFSASLKFRPGYYNDTSHLWLLVGGSYSIPLSCKTEHFNPPTSTNNKYVDNNGDQLNSFFSVGLTIGHETYWGSGNLTRLVLYISGSYTLSSPFNKEYIGFKQGGKSVFSRYPGFDIKELRGIVGFKVLFGKKKK